MKERFLTWLIAATSNTKHLEKIVIRYMRLPEKNYKNFLPKKTKYCKFVSFPHY